VIRIRIYPNERGKEVLKAWFGCARLTYNLALAALKKKTAQKRTEAWLKNRFTNSKNVSKEDAFLLATPTHIRDGAIADLMKGLRTEVAKKKKNPRGRFEMKFRSKKETQSIYLEKTAVKALISADDDKNFLRMYPTHVTNAIFLISKKAKLLEPTGKVRFDARLVLDELGRYHIHATVERDVVPPENQGEDKGVVALDPGVRTFLTGYSPTRESAFEIAPGCVQRMIRLEHAADRLRSDMANLPARCGSRKRRMKRAELRIHERVRHLASEVH
jgi:putative transposase